MIIGDLIIELPPTVSRFPSSGVWIGNAAFQIVLRATITPIEQRCQVEYLSLFHFLTPVEFALTKSDSDRVKAYQIMLEMLLLTGIDSEMSAFSDNNCYYLQYSSRG
jgi:hypothetical protein